MPDDQPRFNNRPQEIWKQSILLPTGSGGGIQQASRSHKGRWGKTGCRQRETGPKAHAFIWPVSGVQGGSWTKAKLVNSNQKRGVFVSPKEVLSDRHIKRSYWETRDSVVPKGFCESPIRVYVYLWLRAAILGMSLSKRLVSG